MGLLNLFKKIEPDKDKNPLLYTVYEGIFTLFYTPNTVTSNGVHIRDKMDLKRTMIIVVLAMALCYIFGMYNIGQQHFAALGIHAGLTDALHLKLAFGLAKLLPIFIISNLVGLGIEFIYAAKRGHGIEEGYLVTGALIPLIMPPDIPLWMLTVAIVFAVIIGKEAFGGTGMNIWNIALLTRVFIFFAYPTTISGDGVWVAGLSEASAGATVAYSWVEMNMFNPIFESLNWDLFNPALTVRDGFTGATPLSLAYQGGWSEVTQYYSAAEMWWGTIPGSIGETSKPLIIIGAFILLIMRIASWRIMLGGLLGAIGMGYLLNVWGVTPLMTVSWMHQLYMGSFFFAIVFMATDPVTAAGTNRGKWIYGILIGVFGIIIRVLNPAYPEGWMLAILLMNTFAPLIDYVILQSNIKKRLKRA